MTIKQGSILVVDDNSDILLTTRVVLKKLYNKIITESNPENIPGIIEKHSFDVILLDMNFSPGETSGKEGIKWLKTIRILANKANVIIITAYGDIDLAVKAMKEGALDFIVKPWDNKKLIATVNAAFKLSRSQKKISDLMNQQQVLSSDIDRQFTKIVFSSEIKIGRASCRERV